MRRGGARALMAWKRHLALAAGEEILPPVGVNGRGVPGEEVERGGGWAPVRPLERGLSGEQGRALEHGRLCLETEVRWCTALGVPWLWKQAGLLLRPAVQVVILPCDTGTRVTCARNT